jgi:hypothetical protein
MSKKIEALIKNLPGLDRFTIEFYHIFTEELTPILLKQLHKIER